MRLTSMLLAIATTITASARAEGPPAANPEPLPSVVLVASTAKSMSDCFSGLKTDLTKTIDVLDKPGKFDVLLFSDGEPTKASDELMLADAAGRKKAHDLVNAAKPSGKSDPVRALKSALAMKPDLVYLLIDQVPDAAALAKCAHSDNPGGHTHINVIYYAGPDDAKNKADTDALEPIVKAGHGELKVIPKPDATLVLNDGKGDGGGGLHYGSGKSDGIDAVPGARAAPVGPVVYALSNSGSMLTAIGDQRRGIVKAIGNLPAGTKFDVIVFADGKSTAMTDAPATSDAKSKGATDDFLQDNPAEGRGDPVPGVKAALAMKPGTLFLTLDQVPDPEALAKAFDDGDPKMTAVLVVNYLGGADPEKDKAALDALDKLVKARHGTLRKVKKPDGGAGK